MADLKSIMAELGTDFFKALSDPSRVQVLMTLASASDACTVSRVAESASVDLSVVSRHLSQLKLVGIVTAEKQGREVFYRLDCDRVIAALRQCADALEACCPPRRCC